MHDYVAELQCWGTSGLNSALSKPWPWLKVSRIHYNENVSFYKCFCLQLFQQNFWEAWARSLWSKFLRVHRTQKNPTRFCPPQGLRAGYVQENVVTEQRNWCLPIQMEVEICKIRERLKNAVQPWWYCCQLRIQHAWACILFWMTFSF